jgi:hypothetical protein
MKISKWEATSSIQFAVFNFTEAINGIIQMSRLFKSISRGLVAWLIAYFILANVVQQ